MSDFLSSPFSTIMATLLLAAVLGKCTTSLQNDKELKILGKDLKKQIRENKSFPLKRFQKKN